jgi:6-phosphogluconate dehydrogenase
MQIGFVGLGRMGLNMCKRLVKHKQGVVAFDLNAKAIRTAAASGIKTAKTLEELTGRLVGPKILWLMVPAGSPTGSVIERLSTLLSRGDIVVDGGNSFYKDSLDRSSKLLKKGIGFLDVGTSGGLWGLKEGYCFMIGGEKAVFRKLEPIFKALSAPSGYEHVGPSGAGHFVKMVHNGIEYGILQSYAEGFATLAAKKGFNLDLAGIARVWNRGSIIRSWLLGLCEDVFKRNEGLAGIKGYVEDSGEGRWTVAEAINENVSAPVITLSLLERLRSRQKDAFSDKLIAALRREFGGHRTF